MGVTKLKLCEYFTKLQNKEALGAVKRLLKRTNGKRALKSGTRFPLRLHGLYVSGSRREVTKAAATVT